MDSYIIQWVLICYFLLFILMLKIVPDLASSNPSKVSCFLLTNTIVLSESFIPELVFRLMYLPCLNPWNHSFLLGVQVPPSGGCCLETKISVLGGLVTTGASLLVGLLSWQGILLASGYSLDSTGIDISLIVKRKKMGLLDLGVQSCAPAPPALSVFIQLVLSLQCGIQLAGENARRGCC